MYLLGLFGTRALWHSMLTWRLSPWRYLYRVRVLIEVWGALVWGVLGRSWGGFAHVATVTLSWRVRDFVVIGGVRVEPERVRFCLGFGFGPGIVGWTGARAVKSAHVRKFSWPKYLFIFCFCSESLLFACCIMSCHVGNKLYWNWNGCDQNSVTYQRIYPLYVSLVQPNLQQLRIFSANGRTIWWSNISVHTKRSR